MQGRSEERIWKQSPLGAFARPAMPCDLCEIFPVGTGDDCPAKVTMALPRPPFGKYHADRNTIETLPTQTVDVRTQKLTFTLTCPLGARGGIDTVARQVTRAVCAEALHAANLEVMRVLRDALPGPHKRCGIDDLLGLASGLHSSHPHPQFPMGVAILLPPSSLARLLADPETRVSPHAGSGTQRTFVNGVEVIAYNAPQDGSQTHSEPAPTYVVPRVGVIGLALSKVAFHMIDKGGHLDFGAHCNMGAAVLSENMSGAIA